MIIRPTSIVAYLVSCLFLVALYGPSNVITQNASSPGTGTDFLQRLVTWDDKCFFIRGERLLLYSGEAHPFRLPVPGLWLDVFEKIKALGFNCVSFYTYWGLHEGKQGRIIDEGIWSLDKFFRAASEAGIYLIARPGPYINAETAAGGFPGWTLRLKSVLRSNSPEFLDATELYAAKIGKAIANAQIINGGPVILPGTTPTTFPSQMNREYIAYVNQQFRKAGIVVPLVNNDPAMKGYFAPGSGLGEVDIYGTDAYPLRYNCAQPSIWPKTRVPIDWQIIHRQQSPTTPFAILEYQGGSATSWGGVDQEQCGALVNAEAMRVLHKQLYGFGVKLINVYMLFGGTNWGNLGDTKLHVIRHADFTSTASTNYRLNVFCSLGNVSIPQLAGQLSLNGRDSKIHVTDYNVGPDIVLRYLTAELFTWAVDKAGQKNLILYGGADEAMWIIKWQVNKARRIIRFAEGELNIHLLWRNDAYNHWTLELPAKSPIGNYSSPSKSSVIIRGGYRMRSAKISGNQLHLRGDVNATGDVELVHEPTGAVTNISFNGTPLNVSRSQKGFLRAKIQWALPSPYKVPDFRELTWKYIDPLPEVSKSAYDDSKWTLCNHRNTTNRQSLQTPTSLYASDYGYHTGCWSFAQSVWINSTFLGSWEGDSDHKTRAHNLTIPPFLQPGGKYVITVLIDHMGQDEKAPGTDSIKEPMGLINFAPHTHPQSDVMWKLTGNIGGEDYADITIGPRNEGAMFAERMGYHLPRPPSADWRIGSPTSDGMVRAGVGFFTTEFELNVPGGYDIPMVFVFSNHTIRGEYGTARHYRSQLYINGYQFGKYVSHLGPQSRFLVPEGILNYNGINTVAMTLWSLDPQGTRLGGLILDCEFPVISGYRKPRLVSMPVGRARNDGY
ncbi:glycoside hydrolase family 35 protein [Tothia fuscella]|uniref:beta-galactosidase n=1 Tax=Tothia fuscella TaxID=1048955 RepID=A0A9P4TWV3_9PEZI|nr:glycoside hydrolase family 35 protein [Tothia fuscella]